MKGEIIKAVRNDIGPHATPEKIQFTEGLPKTRSGKILRGTIKKIADGESYVTPATIDDPIILDEIATALTGLGYPKRPDSASR